PPCKWFAIESFAPNHTGRTLSDGMGNEGRPKTNPEFQRLMIKQSFSLIALSVGLSVFSQTHVPVTHDEIIKVAAADFPYNSVVVTTAEFPGGMQKCMQFVNKSFK